MTFGAAHGNAHVSHVCCSRAKTNLAVIDLGATTPHKQSRAQHLFGAARCFEI